MRNTRTMQAPDGASAAADGGKPSREKTSDRIWLGADGQPVDAEENAVTARYKYVGDGRYADFSPVTDHPATRMFAIFGALTLFGNITNTWKGEKGDRAASPIDEIELRLALMCDADDPKWVDRTGGLGAKIDKDVLAEAMIQLAITAGKVDGNDAGAVGAKKAEYREKLESADHVRMVRKVPAINAKYSELVGGVVKTLDDVL
jgi:hypothetical protein